MKPRIILPLILLSALTACEESQTTEPPADPVGEISGAVYQRLFPEVPVTGAELNWAGSTATTDDEGDYTLTPTAAGAGSLRVTHPNFSSESRWIELDETDQQQSFTLLPLDTTPPPEPLAFDASSVEGTFLRLVWTPPADSSDLAGYWLRKSPGDPAVQRLGIETTSWLDISVAPSRDYSYELSSIDLSGNLSPALTAVAQVNALPTPSRISLLPDGDYGSIPLYWERNKDEDFAAYRIYRSQGAVVDSLDTLVFSSSESPDTSWTDTGVTANELYRYRLYSYDQSGQVSTHPGSGHLRAAAQLFLGIDENEKRLAPLPGRNEFLVSYTSVPQVLLADADGALLASEELGNALPYLKGQADGRVWGFRPDTGDEDAYLALIETDPLALVRDTNLDLEFTDLAAAGDSLILIPSAGGAPLVLDAVTFAGLGSLDLLAGLSDSTLVIAHPDGRRLLFAEWGGARRLLRVDLDAGPAISETATLDGAAALLQMSDDGHLLIAYRDDGKLARYDAMDFTSFSELTVNLSLLTGRFSSTGDSYWQRDMFSNGIEGFSLDWVGGAASDIAHYDQLATPRQTAPLSIGGRIATTMSNGWISLCDPSLDGP
jgi:hypothetical protein